jgi:hypothetical protein
MLWFERKLGQYGHKLRIGDAAKIRARDRRKQKHDPRDARNICALLLKDEFPDLKWVPSLEERDLRQLLLHRHKLVRMRAQVKNQLQHIALNQGQQKKRQLWTKQGRELLEKLELEPWTARRRHDLLKLLDALNGYCEGLDQAVEKAAAARVDAHRLRSHCGIGPVISLAHAGQHRAVRQQPATGQLSGTESLGTFQRPAPPAGIDQQTGQQFSTPAADSRGTNRGARGHLLSSAISSSGRQEEQGNCQGDGSAQAGGAHVLDTEDAQDVSGTGSYAG